MVKVITYGSFDMFHYGHQRLLERAKALGDYLIVGVTSDDFDKTRGKINLQQSLMERVEAVRATGIADEIIIEEYEGQKIDDIKKYDVDIFTVGSDWVGYFDYLREYCQVIYLPRTEGVSSTQIREGRRAVKLGLVGDSQFLNKVWREAKFVNGIHVQGLCTNLPEILCKEATDDIRQITDSYEELLDSVNAVYIRTQPRDHEKHIRQALEAGKHVLCESPVTLSRDSCAAMFELAASKGLVLMEGLKTAYSTAYERLVLLAKGGKIGNIVSVGATCTSMRQHPAWESAEWNGIHEWGPTALLPAFQVLGNSYRDYRIATRFDESSRDSFSKIDLYYDSAVASVIIGDGVKSEGELILSGTKGYIYVPAPWWLTDYFEIRYEDQTKNRRYFYQLDGEGIRYELVAFARAIERGKTISTINADTTCQIAEMMDSFENRRNMIVLS